MRKKGFTLVELIGVVLILGIILILAAPAIRKINLNSKKELYDIQIVNIVDALKLWSVDNSRVLPQNEGETITITLGQLKMGGYIDADLKNPQTNTCFGNDMLLTVSRYRENYIYDVKEDSDTESDSCSDYLKPYIILNGEPIVYVEVGDSYKELGAIAKDQLGNDITNSIVKTVSGTGSTIDTSKVGNKYTVTYSVTAEDVTESVNRTVIVNDTTPPVLTIPKNISIYRNAYNIDLMEGVSATDNSGEPVDITVKSNISFSIPGEYTITYTAKDSSGNTTTKTRLIYVLDTKDETGPTYASYEVKNITNKGYDVYVYGVTDESGIDKVQFPAWTAYNGQDDLAEDWQSALTSSGKLEESGTYYFRVNTLEHNGESGTYYTEIHLYDNSGNETVIRDIETLVPSILVTINVNDSTLGNVSPTTVNVGYGAKYSTSGNKITFPAGQVVTATPVHPTGYTSSFNSWSSTSGTITEETTITANFNKTANTYKIVYNANKGTGAPSDTTYTYAESGTVTLSSTKPTRTGYTFAGWGTSETDTTVDYNAGGEFNKNVASNTTLYAIWTANTDTKYVVNHYQMNTSGTYPSSPTATESKTGTTASTITLSSEAKPYTGFTYSYGQVGGSTVTTTTIAADGSRVINLYYTRNKYTVSLTKGTGISAVSGAGEYYHGVTVTIDATVAPGYEWKNWSGTHSTTTKQYTFTMPISNVSDTANASIVTYTISYNLGCGTVTNPTSYNVTTATFTLNNPTCTGYTFLGWTGSNGNTASTNVSIAKGSTGNKSYTANWQINNYYLDLNGVLDGSSNGGISGYGTADVYINGSLVANDVADYYAAHPYGSTYQITDIRATTGHTYNGVHSGSLTGTIPAGNVATALNFTTNSYYLDLNGVLDGTTSGGISGYGTADVYINGSLVANDVADYYAAHPYGSTYQITDIRATAGHTYNGVYSGSLTGTIPASTVNVYLQFSINTYSVTQYHYYLYDNTTWTHFNTTTDYRTYGTGFAPYNVSAPDGYYAGNNYGYYNSAGAQVGSGTVGSNSFIVTENMSVNVHYYPYQYSITYHANGGSGAPAAQYYIYNPDANTTLSGTIPTRTGYTFLGWSQDPNATSKSYDAGQTWWRGNIGHYNLYAVWSANSITFNYYSNNGSQTHFVTWTAKANSSYPDSHWNYTSGTYAQSYPGYTATGYYGTTTTGGTLVHEDTSFSSYSDLCSTYGVSTQTSSTTINLYAQWKQSAKCYKITWNSGLACNTGPYTAGTYGSTNVMNFIVTSYVLITETTNNGNENWGYVTKANSFNPGTNAHSAVTANCYVYMDGMLSETDLGYCP